MNIKKYVQQVLRHVPDYQASTIIEKIRPYSYVSFDVFDTLLKRSIPDTNDVFSIVAKKCFQNKDIQITETQFKNDRIAAEREARKRINCEEVTLEEIYTYLPDYYNEYRNELLYAEIAQETTCCHANPIMKIVFDWCKSEKKHIFLISDMYLPINIIENILHQCNFGGYDRLYLSSEKKMSKRTGHLFQCCLTENNINPSELIHIGDNLYTDYIRAKGQHISAQWIAREAYQTKFVRITNCLTKQHKEFGVLSSIMNSYISPEWNIYYQYGFEVLGPLLYGFCIWMHEDAMKRGIDKFFFLSRDGYLLQRAYVTLYGKDAIDNTYLYASRRALHVPSIWIDPDFKIIMSRTSSNKVWTFKTVCKELGLEEYDVFPKWEKEKLSKEETFLTVSLLNDHRIQKFYEAVRPLVIENSKKEFEVLKEYLHQNKFFGNVGIVDIGWYGTMQKSLESILLKGDIPAKIWGYYVGFAKGGFKDIQAEAYLTDKISAHYGCGGLFEAPFLRFEGSTKNYRRTCSGEICPELYSFEYLNETREKETFSKIQDGALFFLSCMSSIKENFSITREAAYENMRKLSKYPRIKDVKLFGDLLFLDSNVGTLATPKPLRYYLVRPNHLKTDFFSSGWKCGFMKGLFHIPFPYYKVLEAGKKIHEIKKSHSIKD